MGNSQDLGIKPYYYPNGTFTRVPNLDNGSRGYFQSINSSGVATGYSSTNQPHVITYSGGSLTDTGIIGAGTSINDSGVIVGYSFEHGTNLPQAFELSNGNYTELALSGGGTANAINNSGEIVGYSTDKRSGFYDSSAGIQYMSSLLGAYTSDAYDINQSGLIVGKVNYSSSQVIFNPYIYDTNTSQFKILDSLGLGGAAEGINSKGDAVGYANINNNYTNQDAAVWLGGKLYDLNRVTNLAGSDFSTLYDARAINDSGVIVGYGKTLANTTSAFELIPVVPEPVTWLGAGLGIGAIMLVRRWVGTC